MEAGTILVINGEDSVRALLREALEDEGYRVVLAEPGGLQPEPKTDRPAMILVDVDEPLAHDGLCAEVAASRIPVVALSDASEPTSPGFDAWLTKPFDLDDLDDLARRWAPLPHRATEGSGR